MFEPKAKPTNTSTARNTKIDAAHNRKSSDGLLSDLSRSKTAHDTQPTSEGLDFGLPVYLRQHPSLKIGASDDPRESKARSVARQVSGVDTTRPKSFRPASNHVPAAVRRDVQGRAEGRPIVPSLRSSLENTLHQDLGDVRVHEGAVSARSIGARAFSNGRDVWLAPGESSQDPSLIAHEATHAAQSQSMDPGLIQRQDDSEVAQPDPEWSFDPYSENVAAHTNQELIHRMLAAREWLLNHGIIELDYPAHMILRQRLEGERDFRIGMGHLWLEDVTNDGAVAVVKMISGTNGAIDIVAVENEALLNGPPIDLGFEPIMSLRQFHAFIEEGGFPQVSLEQYLSQASMVQYGADANFLQGADSTGTAYSNYYFGDPFEMAPELDDDTYARAFGIAGSGAYISPRDSGLPRTLGNQSAAGRVGAASEWSYLTSRQNLYGFGATDQNAIVPNHPRTDAGQIFGTRFDDSVKSRTPGSGSYDAANPMSRYGNYLEGHAKLLGTQPDYNGFDLFMQHSARGRTPAKVREQSRLVVDVTDVDGYRSLLADPFANPTGNPNMQAHQYAQIERIYNGVLQDNPIVLNGNGPPLRTVADITSAYQNGRIGLMEYDSYMRIVSSDAIAQVHANPDWGTLQAQAHHDAFGQIHESLRPSLPERHTATRQTGTQTAASPSQIQQFGTYLNRQTQVLAEGGQTLHINPADVPAYQGLLRNPFGHDLTETGRTSRIRNYRRSAVSGVYDAALAQADQVGRPVRSSAGEVFTSVDQIDTALQDGRITTQEHFQLIDQTGQLSARSIAANNPADDAAHRQASRTIADRRRAANAEITSRASPEYMASTLRGGGLRGDVHVAGQYGGRAAILGAVMGGGMEYAFSENGWEDPRTRERVYTAMGREGLRGGLGGATEAVAASQTSRYLLGRGMQIPAGRALAMRLGARAAPGVVDVGFEWYDMATDGRENSTEEVTYRSGRALVIGGTSAVLGSIAGSAAAGAVAGSVVPGVGTAIGFVVGLAVGIGVGLAMSYAIPTYADLQAPRRRPTPRREFMLPDAMCQGGHHRICHAPTGNFEGFGTGTSLLQQYAFEQRNGPDATSGQSQLSPADIEAIRRWIEMADTPDRR